MTKNVIEWYDTSNTKGCPDGLISCDFNDQTIPYDYYNLLSYDDEHSNNFPGNPVDDALPDNKGVEDAVMKNGEEINNGIIIDNDDVLASNIDPLQN